jgi:hypothetical protein
MKPTRGTHAPTGASPLAPLLVDLASANEPLLKTVDAGRSRAAIPT